MPITLDETVSGEDSNTYHTIATADAFFAERFQAEAWTGETDVENKKRALVESCRALSRLRYKGRRNNPAQALPFPRAVPYHCDPGAISGAAVIPTVILEAQALEALAILRREQDGGRPSTRQDLQQQGVRSYQNGTFTEVYSDFVVAQNAARFCSDEILPLLRPWMAITGQIVDRLHGSSAWANGPTIDDDED